MIEVHRGEEPPELADLRARKLTELRDLIKKEGRPPLSKEIHGYALVGEQLWKAQHHKCCYCERVIECKYYDVEHYRPKAEANRGPGHAARHGYWWLAFTWENLLFSCKNCNEGKAKGIQFPLTAKSIPLIGEQAPPHGERPLLIDPATECGIEHIQFRRWADGKWRPAARDGSDKGRETIRVCALDRDELLTVYTTHVNSKVRPCSDKVLRALQASDASALRDAVRDANLLLRCGREYVGLSYDALHAFVPAASLTPWGHVWRRPA